MSGTRSSNSSKEKKSKSSSSNVQTNSSISQQNYDENNELERQYQTYKQQFDEWTAKHKGKVSEEAYNKYVEQFKNWEKEIDERRKSARSKQIISSEPSSSSMTNGSANYSGNGPSFDPSAMMNMDPMSSMMMMAMMMMPFMMMGAADPSGSTAPPSDSIVPPSAAPVEPANQEPGPVSITGKPVSYKKQPQPKAPSAPLPGFIPLPDFSKPPPIAAPVNAAPPADRKQIEMDRVRRGHRTNDRYFIDDQPAHNRQSAREQFYHRSDEPFSRNDPQDNYEDVAYRRYRERVAVEEAQHRWERDPPGPWDRGQGPWERDPGPVPLFPDGFRPRSPPVNLDRMFRGQGFEPLQRGPEPWNQSGFGANDFSMRGGHGRRY